MTINSGIDSVTFTLPKATFLKFLKRLNIDKKLRLINRNQKIKEYADYKFKNEATKRAKAPFKIKYLSFKRGLNSLSNSMIVIENSASLNALCVKRKKKFGFYVSVVFAGLYQPSREIFKLTYKVLGSFLKRFKADLVDYATDYLTKNKAGASFKEKFRKRIKKFGTQIISYKKTLYANLTYSRFYGLKKICYYDKYDKQKNYHKQEIGENFKDWHRLEVTLKIGKKLREFFYFVGDYEIGLLLGQLVSRLEEKDFLIKADFLKEQIDFFKDNRKKLSLKKLIF